MTSKYSKSFGSPLNLRSGESSYRKSSRKSSRKPSRKPSRNLRSDEAKLLRKLSRKISRKLSRKSRKSSRRRRFTGSNIVSGIPSGARPEPSVGRPVHVTRGTERAPSLVEKAFPRLFTIYTQDGCGACIRAKDLLDKRGFKYRSYVRKDHEELVTKLTNNYEYVPVVFDGDKFIGGYKDLEKYLNLNNV